MTEIGSSHQLLQYGQSLKQGALGIAILTLSACATTPGTYEVPYDPPVAEEAKDTVIAEPNSEPDPPPEVKAPPPEPAPPPEDTPPPDLDISNADRPLAQLPHWSENDPLPALKAFRQSCKSWGKAEPDSPLNTYLPEYGTFSDWKPVCDLADDQPDTSPSAREFFEAQFVPVALTDKERKSGLITGYYQPEVDVRRVADAEFSEPVLAPPKTKALQNQPRSEISAKTSRVIAYGRPLDVFFMQVQGSGHIRFKDGDVIRAAFADHNSHEYTSIGRLLVKRGELTRDRSSKRDIEAWMEQAGPTGARALMNQNKRYIYFTEQAIRADEGPVGAMLVPLTAMGSMAVDPRYHPYGTPIYLTVNLPEDGGDYEAEETGILVMAQDTGSAIKGALRGDLYFGSGAKAGALAGVMKHSGTWMVLLPRELAEKQASSS